MDGLMTVRKGRSVCWVRKDGPLTLAVPGADSAHAQGDMLFVLTADPPALPHRLTVFGRDGMPLAELPPPPGHVFQYLSRHIEAGMSVVCTAEMPAEQWPNWHFGYDSQKRALVRLGRAY
ncbi:MULTISPECIES: hypothetical protein [Nitrospirillum]|uniref:Uncharacterized protein n=1 Tax=Nitrospirillum amazonense TaxID=28077 RepID=A0A560FJC9_9PROT|nr:hypothetical protein [Nitrospirillum amazonense]MEC4592348.1 hypothetical protein [Nitrospirillum amazonense]TWB21705.1 hypothetical protein FBZ88_11759 [Nitrospirillum amazonense]